MLDLIRVLFSISVVTSFSEFIIVSNIILLFTNSENLSSSIAPILIKADSEQISRVFINLIKNSIESLNEKYQKNNKFIKKIIIEITEINDYIEILIIDNGIGFGKVMMPLRLALVGALQGPDVFDIMYMIGKAETVKRIAALVKMI